MPLLHSPRDVVGLGTGLLGQDGEDLPCASLGGVEALADEHDPAAHLLEFIEDHPDMGHAPARQAVEPVHVQRLDAALKQCLEGTVQERPLNLLAGGHDLLELELGENLRPVASGGLVVHTALVGR